MFLNAQKFHFFSRRRAAVLAAVLAVAFVFLIPRPVWAQDEVGKAIVQVIGRAVFAIVQFLVGNLLQFLIGALQRVAEYNSFINSAAVSKGWIIVRDIILDFYNIL